MQYVHSLELSSATQHAMLLEFGEKWRTEVSLGQQSILTLGSQVPSSVKLQKNTNIDFI